MLSLLPDLLAWQFFGIAFLRVVLALIVGAHAWEHLKDARASRAVPAFTLGILEALIAIFLFIGLFTQAAALLLAVVMIASLALKYNHRDNYPRTYYLLLAAIALALITLGPGAYAIDWPL